MIILKSDKEIHAMRESCTISAKALKLAGETLVHGISTIEVDLIVQKFIEKCGAKPSFLGYDGFPSSICISINDEVIHGIPSDRIIKNGDIVSIDVGAYYNGFHGDNATTFAVGKVSPDALGLMKATKESLYEGIKQAVNGARIGDIGAAVQEYVTVRGYSVVRQFVGHGVGANLHEDPQVPNFGTRGRGPRLVPGMVLAIEPMINMGAEEVRILENDWTVVTVDGMLSAHFEHTIAVTEEGPLILTEL